jgi:hypothetical protein
MILNSPYISGSLTVTGNTTLMGALTVTGSLAGTATSSSFAYTASSAVSAYTAASAVNATTALTASYATSFTVGGTLTAQTLVVQTITSSVSFVTGSTRFGSLLTNTHEFTGSMFVTGSTAFFAGNVGIGTTSPGTKLDVRTDTGVLIRGATSNSDAILSFLPTTGGRQYDFRNFGSSFAIVDSSANVTRMYFNFNGNTGIGLTDPSALLHISGSGSGSLMRISSHVSSSIFFVSGSGNVGIGTTAPSTLLDLRLAAIDGVAGSVSSSYAIASFVVNASGGGQRGLQIGGPTGGISSPVFLKVFGTGQRFAVLNETNVENFTVTNGGNVGIGTIDVTHRLTMQNGTSEVGIRMTDGTNNTYFAHAAANGNFANGSIAGDAVIRGSNGISFAPNNGSSTAMRITSGGNVGIGTTPATYVEINRLFSVGSAQVDYLRLTSSQGGAWFSQLGIQFRWNDFGNGAAWNMASILASPTWNGTTTGGGDLVFNTKTYASPLSTEPTEKMRIYASGAVTKNLQPFVIGGLDGNQSISLNTFTTLNFSTSVGMFYYANVGNCWNNSTRAFTAPVTGVYMVNLSVLTDSIGQVALHVNGARRHSIPSPPYTGTVTWGGSAMIPLSSGEVLTLQGYGNAGTVTQNTFHTFFAIYLLG